LNRRLATHKNKAAYLCVCGVIPRNEESVKLDYPSKIFLIIFGNEKQNAAYKFEQFPPCVGMTAIFQHQTVFCIYYLLIFYYILIIYFRYALKQYMQRVSMPIKQFKYLQAVATVIPRNEESAQ